MHPIRVHAPAATAVAVVLYDGDRPGPRLPLTRDGDDWVGAVPAGAVYGLVAAGARPRFDPAKTLLDPRATVVWFPPGHDRALAAHPGADNAGRGPLAVATPSPPVRPARRSTRAPVVYEAHVAGLTRRAGGTAPGTYRALLGELSRLAALGVSVLELLPVHQCDPLEGSYWGYMPLAFGAVHRQYAVGEDAAAELADVVAAAHAVDVEVWLDVVFNHTTEIDATGPTYSYRGLADEDYYRLADDGSYLQSSGCGNDIDTTSRAAQDLIVWALDRLADLGVDGFRFDLAPVLSHDEAFIARLDAWAAARGVRLVAEPWDATGRHQLGRAWPGQGWLQWNDRFRDDVRSFLRGDGGCIGALIQRVQGSPDVFASPMHSVNFLTCHDGLTLYDVVAYDRKHNAANGHDGRDGADDDRSWNCGHEGDDGAPDEVLALRQRQLRNAWCLLALSHGVPMWAAGDEFGRTQGGNNNAYNQDNETSWVDWERRRDFAALERFVHDLLTLRRRHPVLAQPEFWGSAARWFGTDGAPDLAAHSRSLAWQVGDLYMLANAWDEPLTFTLQVAGPWGRVVDTSLAPPDDIVAPTTAPPVADHYTVAGRTVVVLERSGQWGRNRVS